MLHWDSIASKTSNTSPVRSKSLAPGTFDYSLKLVNFTLISTINILSIIYEIAITPHWSLVNIGSAPSLYLSQCWPRSLSPYYVTRLQWVNYGCLLWVFWRKMIYKWTWLYFHAKSSLFKFHMHFDGLVQERRNSVANALELRLSCTDPPIYTYSHHA